MNLNAARPSARSKAVEFALAIGKKSAMKMLNAALAAVSVFALAGCMTKRIEPPVSQAVLEAREHAKAVRAAPPDRCAQLTFSTATPVMAPFAYNGSELTEETKGLLDRAAAWLACNPAIYVTLTAQHDNQGGPQAQKALIDARLAAVRRGLTASGVDAARLLPYRPDAGGTLEIDARGRGW